MADGQLDVTAVEAALADFRDPETGRSALRLEQIRDIRVSDHGLSLTLALTTWAAPLWSDVQRALEDQLRAVRDCVSGMGEEARSLVDMRYVQGMTLHSISSKLGKSLSWSKVAFFRMRKHLLECVERRLKRPMGVRNERP